MDSGLPKVPTLKSILGRLEINGKKFDKKEIEKLQKLKLGSEPMFSLKERDFIYETLKMMKEFGFEDTFQYLKSSQKENSRDVIIRNSPLFQNLKRRNFIDITKDLTMVKVESHIGCPRCKQHYVNTQSRQTRSADEGETDFHTCTVCNYQWNE